jgi:hypothetical protein
MVHARRALPGALVTFVLGAALGACTSFGEAVPDASSDASPDRADQAADASTEASPDAAAAQATVQCGAARCPVGPDSVCCITNAGASCTSVATCNGARLTCDDTEDCAALGFAATDICCAYNDGNAPTLLRSACVRSSACNADGPQDQLCDPAGPKEQCRVARDGRTLCEPFTYSNAAGYAFCVTP